MLLLLLLLFSTRFASAFALLHTVEREDHPEGLVPTSHRLVGQSTASCGSAILPPVVPQRRRSEGSVAAKEHTSDSSANYVS